MKYKNNPEVSLTASKVYSYIPSSFLNNTMIPTQFFFSVFIEGKFEVVEDLSKKRKVLYELVKSMNPKILICRWIKDNLKVLKFALLSEL